LNILVAEDESDIRSLLALSLQKEGYTTFAVKDGLEAWEVFCKEDIHLAVLDVMMPNLDGLNLLRKIRVDSTMPVIMLTARSEEMDKVLGLGLGADDYLAKPFSMAELLARVNAQLRRNYEYFRSEQNAASTIVSGNLMLDKDGCCIFRDGQQLELNAKEFHLLKFLMENPSKVFTKKQLYRAVWDEDLYYDDNTIMVHISHLRNKIEPDPKNLITIRGIGYKFQKQDGPGR
jgi:DNA-binding response OmpR family regulator